MIGQTCTAQSFPSAPRALGEALVFVGSSGVVMGRRGLRNPWSSTPVVETIPEARPVGHTLLVCHGCGCVMSIHSDVLLHDGFTCPCGALRVPGRGNFFKKAGDQIRRAYPSWEV